MQSPIQSSLSSPSQDHGYCSNTNGNDRQVLEKNLEKLISERGMVLVGNEEEDEEFEKTTEEEQEKRTQQLAAQTERVTILNPKERK